MYVTLKMVGRALEEPRKSYYIRKTKRPYEKKTEKPCHPDLVYYKDYVHLKTLLLLSKKRALEKGLEWDVDLMSLRIPKTCPYLGMPLTFIRGQGRVQSNISIDRKDSTKGYTADNIEFISDLANRMKQEATREQLVSFAYGILHHLQK
jgi:hypothetical protein